MGIVRALPGHHVVRLTDSPCATSHQEKQQLSEENDRLRVLIRGLEARNFILLHVHAFTLDYIYITCSYVTFTSSVLSCPKYCGIVKLH